MITIATGVPALDHKIAETFTESTILKTEDQLNTLHTPLVVWSYYLINGRNNAQKKERVRQWLVHFRQEKITSVFLCPYEDWIYELEKDGFTGLVPITNNNVPIKRLFNIIEDSLKQTEREATPQLTFTDDPTETKLEDTIQKTNVWAFWSAKPGMGVSTLTQSLAIELAKAGHKTLLIEWDTTYPSVPFTFGLADRTRCLEKWVMDVESGVNPRIQDYLLNKERWLSEHKDRGIRKAIQKLPDNFYVLAPSNEIKPWEPLTSKVGTIKKTLEDVKELGFSMVIVDVPSEVTHSATAVTFQKADHAFVVLDGKGSHAVLTKMTVDFIEKELGISFHLVLNRVDEGEVKNIQKGMDKHAVLHIPFDTSLGKRSLELNPSPGEEYRTVLIDFLRDEGFIQEPEKKRKWLGSKAMKKRKNKAEEKPNELAAFLKFSS